MASTFEIGKQLVELCKALKNIEAVEKLYADDIVSVEAVAMPGMDQTMAGKDKILAKNKWFFENHEIHSNEVEGPFPHADQFIVHFKLEVTAKVGPMAGKRMPMQEAALYLVRHNKIVKEQFFYPSEGECK